jgi:hypothetical protein
MDKFAGHFAKSNGRLPVTTTSERPSGNAQEWRVLAESGPKANAPNRPATALRSAHPVRQLPKYNGRPSNDVGFDVRLRVDVDTVEHGLPAGLELWTSRKE